METRCTLCGNTDQKTRTARDINGKEIVICVACINHKDSIGEFAYFGDTIYWLDEVKPNTNLIIGQVNYLFVLLNECKEYREGELNCLTEDLYVYRWGACIMISYLENELSIGANEISIKGDYGLINTRIYSWYRGACKTKQNEL